MRAFANHISVLCFFILSLTSFSYASNHSTSKNIYPDIYKKLPNPGDVNQLFENHVGLNSTVLKTALRGYVWAEEKGKVRNHYLTIADLNMPSKDKRLWVIDMNTDKIVYSTLVANGKGSGLYRGNYFSNRPGTDASSLGVYITGAEYVGDHPYSLRLHGLEPGINSNAYRRAIVVHPAWYVSQAFANQHGRVGRSWGCFAVSKTMAPKIDHLIKDGSVLFAYGKSELHDPNLARV